MPAAPDAGPVAQVAPPPDAMPPPPPDAAPPPPDAAPPLTFPPDPPDVKGKHHALEKNKPLKLGGGRTVTWTGAGHKIKMDGGDVAFHEITIAKGKKKDELRVGGNPGAPLEDEVDVYGTLVVFRGTWDSLEAIVVGKAPKPLGDDEAIELIEARAAEAGLPASSGSAASEDGGFFEYEARDDQQRGLWAARVGVYTRRVWFFAASADQ